MTRKTMPEALGDTELDRIQGGANAGSVGQTVFTGVSVDGQDWFGQRQDGSSEYLDGSDVGLSAKRRFETDFGDPIGNYN